MKRKKIFPAIIFAALCLLTCLTLVACDKPGENGDDTPNKPTVTMLADRRPAANYAVFDSYGPYDNECAFYNYFKSDMPLTNGYISAYATAPGTDSNCKGTVTPGRFRLVSDDDGYIYEVETIVKVARAELGEPVNNSTIDFIAYRFMLDDVAIDCERVYTIRIFRADESIPLSIPIVNTTAGIIGQFGHVPTGIQASRPVTVTSIALSGSLIDVPDGFVVEGLPVSLEKGETFEFNFSLIAPETEFEIMYDYFVVTYKNPGSDVEHTVPMMRNGLVIS